MSKPDTFAARAELAGVHASVDVRASLEAEPLVAPPARKKAEPQTSKRRKVKVERATAEPQPTKRRKTRVEYVSTEQRVMRVTPKRASDKAAAEAKPAGDLISALKKLVTPEPKEPTGRKHRKQAKADAQR
jgi:hypothetical protein